MLKISFKNKESNSSQFEYRLSRVIEVTDDMGEIGQDFNRQLQETGCQEKLFDDLTKHELLGVFMSHDLNNKFQNMIGYSPNLTLLPELTCLRFHEGVHAMQHQNSAALHLFPNNSLKIALSPRHYIWANELIERDALAKTAMLSALLLDTIDFKGTQETEVLDEMWATAREFTDLFNTESGKILEHLATTSNQLALQPPTDEYTSKLDFYKVHALNNFYENLFHVCEKQEGLALVKAFASSLMGSNGEGVIQGHFLVPPLPFTFVRLDKEDILSLGESFGPNFFAGENPPDFVNAPPTLSPEHEEAIADLNESLGIKDENALPTLGEALAAYSLTRKEFLKMCLNNQIQDHPLCLDLDTGEDSTFIIELDM